MGRIRSLKPEFFRSRSLAKCSRDARITFAGLWTEADDHGRGIADARLLKGAIWPLDDDITPAIIDAHLDELAADGDHILLYEVDGERYFAVVHWEKHQAAAYRRGTSVHPPPPKPNKARTRPRADACKEVQDAHESVLEQGTGNREGKRESLAPASPAPKSSAPPTREDPLFEAVAEACRIDRHQLTPSARGPLNRATAELRGLHATPDEVRKRGRIWPRLYPQAELTPSALVKHWPRLGNGSGPAPPPVRCQHCGAEGHPMADCPKLVAS